MDFHDEFIMALRFKCFAELAFLGESFDVVIAGVVCLFVCAHFALLSLCCELIDKFGDNGRIYDLGLGRREFEKLGEGAGTLWKHVETYGIMIENAIERTIRGREDSLAASYGDVPLKII
jgi:hypothetical protein